MPEFDFSSLIEKKEPENKKFKTKKLASGMKKIKTNENSMKNDPESKTKITSDEIRTAYYLINKSSARGSVESIFNDLKRFFNTTKIKKEGKDFFLIPN